MEDLSAIMSVACWRQRWPMIAGKAQPRSEHFTVAMVIGIATILTRLALGSPVVICICAEASLAKA